MFIRTFLLDIKLFLVQILYCIKYLVTIIYCGTTHHINVQTYKSKIFVYTNILDFISYYHISIRLHASLHLLNASSCMPFSIYAGFSFTSFTSLSVHATLFVREKSEKNHTNIAGPRRFPTPGAARVRGRVLEARRTFRHRPETAERNALETVAVDDLRTEN